MRKRSLPGKTRPEKAVILAVGSESQAWALAGPVPLLDGEGAREVGFNTPG